MHCKINKQKAITMPHNSKMTVFASSLFRYYWVTSV